MAQRKSYLKLLILLFCMLLVFAARPVRGALTADVLGTITGTVTAAEDNALLNHVQMCAFQYDGADYGFAAIPFYCDAPDVNGIYTIPLPPGTYRVWALPVDRLRRFYNNADRYGDGDPVVVTADTVTSGIDFSLPLAGVIAGHIYRDDGVTPMVGITIRTQTSGYVGCSGADGSYELMLPSGTYVIIADGYSLCDQDAIFPGQYYNGSMLGQIPVTPITVTVGERIENINFVRMPDEFLPPSLYSPSGAVMQTAVSFEWEPVRFAAGYQLRIAQLDGTFETELSYEPNVCNENERRCSVNDILLPNGSYQWWMRAWRPTFGYSPWSSPVDFQVTAHLESPLQSSPFGLISNLNPTYTWGTVAYATWYYLWVADENGHVLDHWYAAVDICNAALCSVVPTETLTSGDYQWWLQAWSPYSGYSTWSAAENFTVMFFTPPTQTAPSGLVDSAPQLQWQDMSGSSWWQVWVSDSHGNGGGTWYPADSICAGGMCSVAPPLNVSGDAYTWWVQTWNAVAGYSAWSAGLTFWLPLHTPTALEPLGVIADDTPTFHFSGDSRVTWYYLWLSGDSGHVLDQWYNAFDICTGGMCEVTPLTLAEGNYHWWVQPYSPYDGYGSWSGQHDFTIDLL